MSSYDLDLLLWPAMLILFVTLVVTFHATRLPIISLISTLVKVGIFVVYFALVFNGTYTFIDDWTYLEGGSKLAEDGVGITNLHQNWEYALMIGGGDHFIYYLYNAYAQRLFGNYYFSPVTINIVLTVMIAYVGSRLAVNEFKFTSNQARYLYLFLLFHPDILAWSNVMNGKDILVLLLHVLILFVASLFFCNKMRSAFLLGIPVVLILLFLRFYVPLLFVLALLLSILVGRNLSIRNRLRFLIAGALGMVGAATWIGVDGITYVNTQLRENLVHPLYGFVRMILTPIPFNTEPAYSFLDVPALLHWLMIPLVVVGVFTIYRLKTPFSAFFIAYFFIFIFVYSVFGELQGPRHRVQLDFAFAVFQFSGLLVVIRSLSRSMVSRRIPL